MERYLTLLGIHDFVQQVARYDSLKNRQDCQFSQAPLARMINLNA